MTQERACIQCGGTVSAVAVQGYCPACLAVRGLESNTLNRLERKRSQWSPPSNDQIAAHFAELDQVQLIGRGGMGAVYRARQKNLDRIVALKILPPQLMEDAAFAERFAREAQAMARLNHPNIITIHDFGQREGLFYFIMEYVDGLTLRQLMARGPQGRMTVAQAAAAVPQICDALQYAHDQAIVHRDIKPENILVSRRGNVKIADFGLAKLMDSESETQPVPVTATIGAVGTPLYMAPEQIEHAQDVDHRADIYSLGVVFYQLLTGELPETDLRPPSTQAGVDARLDELVLRAMHPDPSQRFESVTQLKTLLQTIVTEPGSIAISPREPSSGGLRSDSAVNRSEADRQTLKTARASLAIPARGIKYVAIFNIALLCIATLLKKGSLTTLLSFVAAAPEKVIDNPLGLHLQLPWWATGAFVFTMLNTGLNAFVAAGARRMRELRSYGWSLTSAILCIFATPGNVVGAVFGVWAIVILARAQTRQAFGVTRGQLPAPSAPAARGMIGWWPLVRVHSGRKVTHLVNFTLLAVSTWLLSYAMVSLVLLGNPGNVLYALLLIVPALALPQSIARLHRRLSVESLGAAQTTARRPVRMGLRIVLPLASLLLYTVIVQALSVRDLAEQRAAATQPAKPTVTERLHITVPGVSPARR